MASLPLRPQILPANPQGFNPENFLVIGNSGNYPPGQKLRKFP